MAEKIGKIIEQRTGYDTVSGNTRWTHTLYCPTGYQIVSGGGGHRDNNSAGWDIRIAYSGPDPSSPSTAWRLMLVNTSSSSRALVMFCNCAKIRYPPGPLKGAH
jgi:hypothetical protein